MLDYHRELLADETRTGALREAVARTVRAGDVVIDIGCGSGILSFFACQAGAARVYAIESGPAARIAAWLSRHLGFDDRITVIRNEARAVELPERADVLLTETLGILGFDEGIAGIVRDARARLLLPGARILPRRVGVSLVPVELDYDYDRHVAFWSEPRYGLDLSPMRAFASNALAFAHIRSNAYLADPREVLAIDFSTDFHTDVSGRASFTIVRDAQLHGFGGFFRALLADGIELSNQRARSTSWSQALLPLERPVAVTRGTRVEVELQMDDGKAWRWRGRAGDEEFDQTTWLAIPP